MCHGLFQPVGTKAIPLSASTMPCSQMHATRLPRLHRQTVVAMYDNAISRNVKSGTYPASVAPSRASANNTTIGNCQTAHITPMTAELVSASVWASRRGSK